MECGLCPRPSPNLFLGPLRMNQPSQSHSTSNCAHTSTYTHAHMYMCAHMHSTYFIFGRMFCKALSLSCLISLLQIFLDLVLLASAASLLFSFPYVLFLIFQSFKIMVKKCRSVGFCLLCVFSIVFVARGHKYWKSCNPSCNKVLTFSLFSLFV